jgi:hypothetical protein
LGNLGIAVFLSDLACNAAGNIVAVAVSGSSGAGAAEKSLALPHAVPFGSVARVGELPVGQTGDDRIRRLRQGKVLDEKSGAAYEIVV